MFKLSTRSSYGLRACLALARLHGGPPVATTTLSAEHNIPRRYLEQILSQLRQNGLVKSTRGPRGGYALSREPKVLTVAEIIRALEGDMPPMLCSVPELRNEGCRTQTGCVSQRLCHELESTLIGVLSRTTLEDLRLEAALLDTGLPNRDRVPVNEIRGVPTPNSR